jgi:uncharacterized protein (TIGR03435 family)
MKRLVVMVLASVCFAQQLEFEVASVKQSPPITGDTLTVRMGGDSAMQHFSNVSMASLIQHAFHLKSYQLIGPDWMPHELYDIEAKLPAGAHEKQAPAMFQKLLADRFHLVYHREQRDLPVYVLTVAKGGVKTHPPDKKDEPKEMGDGTYSMRGSGAGLGFVDLPGYDQTLEDLAALLSNAFDRPVVDRTGLTGKYQFKMHYEDSPDRSLSDAIHEFLGLKVESGKAPIDVLVIDRLDRVPVAN